MARAIMLVFTLAALSASAFDFEKFIEKQMDRKSESWKREAIETLAKGDDPKERLEAAEFLSGHRDPESVMALAGALSDREAKVRFTAASGLWRVEKAAEPARPQLMKALAAFGPKPEGWTPLLLGRLESPEARVRYAALGHLRQVKKEKDVATWAPRAAAMLHDPDSSVRSEALWALGSAAGLAAGEIDKVVAAPGDPDRSVRRSAAMEKDEDADVRSEARRALANLGSGTTVAVAASTSTGAESGGMAVLRARKVTFEESSFFRALSEVDVELVRAFLDAGMSPKASVADVGK